MDRHEKAAAQIREMTGTHTYDMAVVLGSGWGEAVGKIGRTRCVVPLAELSGFYAPVVHGHGSSVRDVAVGDKSVLVFQGRTHLYEGHGPQACTHAVSVAAELGCSSIILTNGAGSLRERLSPGEPVILSDHINLTGESALEGPQFIDMTEVYSPRLRALAHQARANTEEGVYCAMRGPAYETPAEVRMAGIFGADLVGMSTVLEATKARALGLEVLGISLATNWAAGFSGEKLNHAEVLAAGLAAAGEIGDMLHQIVTQA